jgi:hypothetical protein
MYVSLNIINKTRIGEQQKAKNKKQDKINTKTSEYKEQKTQLNDVLNTKKCDKN